VAVAAAENGGASAILTATPLARRVARIHAVALERVPGTGPRGRITRADVLKAAGVALQRPVSEPGGAAAYTPAAPAPAPVLEGAR
jgi:pyruvate dehydrogenase E2 component (dihydrolipoamide acetyltransferase)